MIESNLRAGRARRRLGRVMATALAVALTSVACASDDVDPADAGDASSTGASGVGEDAGNGQAVNVVWDWDHALTLPGSFFEEAATEKLAEMIEEGTDGQLKLNVRVGQTAPNEAIEAIQSGRADGGQFYPVVYSGTHPQWTVLTLAMTFRDWEHWNEVKESMEDQITADMEEKTGLVNPAGLMSTSKQVAFTEEPLETLEDWDGLRLRAPGANVAAFVGAVGATPTTMPFSEVYPAMQRGALEGFLSSYDAAVAVNPWELTNVANDWNIGYEQYTIMINPDSLAELPEDLQETVLGIFEDFADYYNENYPDVEGQQQPYIDQGMEIFTPSPEVQDAAMAELGPQLREEWISVAGEEYRAWIDEIEATL